MHDLVEIVQSAEGLEVSLDGIHIAVGLSDFADGRTTTED